jgi:hypothetical protein
MADHTAAAGFGTALRRHRAYRSPATPPASGDTGAALSHPLGVPQLMMASTAPSIERVPVTVTRLALDRHSGTVSGILTGSQPLLFLPQFVHTDKGRARVSRDGSITYTPAAAARQAAGLLGASYRRHDRDVVDVNALDAHGRRVLAQVTIAILGS